MIKMTLKFDENITKTMDKIEKTIDPLIEDTYDFFVKQTPIRSGNARRRTRLNADTITANYAYAERLDNGHSKQAPNGMTEPTVAYFQKEFAKRIKGL